MASHAFITTWLMAPGKVDSALGTEWSVGFRGMYYSVVEKFSVVMNVKFSYTPGGSSVGIEPSSSDTKWQESFPKDTQLAFCGWYWWKGAWFGGFIDWWPIKEGSRHSRGLENADGQFEKAAKAGVKNFAFCITNMHGSRTNIGYFP